MQCARHGRATQPNLPLLPMSVLAFAQSEYSARLARHGVYAAVAA
jgi:hypothetical protein